MAEGWTVNHVKDGETGLKMIAKDSYDLILLDLMLPGISGQDTCRKFRARNITTPIIMLTALDENTEVIQGLQIGADDYITNLSTSTYSLPELKLYIAAVKNLITAAIKRKL